MIASLLNLFYPERCRACAATLGTGEHMLCTACRHQLPVAGLHHSTQQPMHKLLYGRVPPVLCTSLFYFDKKSRVQELIHNLKYRGQEDIGSFLGKWLGAELAEIKSYQTIDCVVPVPLHKKRLRERGYNQVAGFGREIASALGVPYVDTVLFRSKSTRTQVFLSRMFRGTEVLDSFGIKNAGELNGKHILLVDDLITTGGTVEGCYLALNTIPGIQLSIAVMAMTR